MFSLRILTPWSTGTEGGNVPYLPQPLPAGSSWNDVTGKQSVPGNPTANVWEGWHVPDAYLATLEADPAVEVLEAEEEAEDA